MKEFFNAYLPNDFSVYYNGNGWIWDYRCLNSEDDYDLVFNSETETLCHFISIVLESMDKETVVDEEE